MLINALGNVYNVCVVPENCHTSPQRATEILRGGGVQKSKMVISKGVGMLTVVFFPVGLSKIGKLLINFSFSVEEAINYFTVYTFVSKQVLLFTLIIFYL